MLCYAVLCCAAPHCVGHDDRSYIAQEKVWDFLGFTVSIIIIVIVVIIIILTIMNNKKAYQPGLLLGTY